MAKTSELLNRRGCGGILTPLPTCQPVAFNCSLSVTRVLGKVTVSPVFLQAGSPAPGALSPGPSRVFLTHESPGQQHTCSSPVQGPPGTVRPRSRVHSACYPLPQVLRGRCGGGGSGGTAVTRDVCSGHELACRPARGLSARPLSSVVLTGLVPARGRLSQNKEAVFGLSQ